STAKRRVISLMPGSPACFSQPKKEIISEAVNFQRGKMKEHHVKLYILTSPSSLPLHIRLSLRPMHVTGPACPVKVCSHLPVLGSHTFTMRSSAPDTMRSVSAPIAHTPSTWPKRVRTHRPVSTSHKQIVESKPLVRMYFGGLGRSVSPKVSRYRISSGDNV